MFQRTSPFAIVPFLVCFLLALSLWLYATMREQYTTVVELPFDVRFPHNRSPETILSPTVRAKVQGTGWQLVNMLMFSSSRCMVEISEKMLPPEQSFVRITRTMFLQGIQMSAGLQVLAMLPDSLNVKVGMISEKKVPVLPQLQLVMREGFVATGVIQVAPDSVIMRGNKKILSDIGAWNTKPLLIKDVFESFTAQTSLSDSLAGTVQIPQTDVTVKINVEQLAEITFEDIPVRLLSAPLHHNVMVKPAFVSVTLRGGISQIVLLTRESVSASVEYLEALTNTTGTISPHIAVPSSVESVHTTPARLQCTKRIQLVQKRSSAIVP